MYPYKVNDKPVIFAYFRDKSGRMLTAGYIRDGAALRVAYAVQSKRDTFTKKRGREIVMGRLNADKVVDLLQSDHHTYSTVLMGALHSQHINLPTQTAKSIDDYLNFNF